MGDRDARRSHLRSEEAIQKPTSTTSLLITSFAGLAGPLTGISQPLEHMNRAEPLLSARDVYPDVNLLRDLDRVIDLDAEVANGAFDL